MILLSLMPKTIIWATGYRRHYPWLHVPEAVGSDGGIVHGRGCTAVPGLFVLGTRWQYRLTSHQIGGVGADAAVGVSGGVAVPDQDDSLRLCHRVTLWGS